MDMINFLYQNFYHLILLFLHLIFIVIYLIIRLINRQEESVSLMNLNSIQTIKIILDKEKRKTININIKPNKGKIHLESQTNTLYIDSKVAQLPLLSKIIKTSICFWGGNFFWFKYKFFFKTLYEILWVISITLIFLTLIFPQDNFLKTPIFIILILLILGVLRDLFIANRMKKLFLLKLKKYKIIDNIEIKKAKKIISTLLYKDLIFYIAPLLDFLKLIKKTNK